MIMRFAKRFSLYQLEDAVADKFTLFGKAEKGTDQGQDNGSLDEGFFEEFSFDDFDYDDIFGSEPEEEEPPEPVKEEKKDNVQQVTPPVTAPVGKEQPVVTPPVIQPVQKEQLFITPPQSGAQKTERADQYENLYQDKESLAPKTEIEPDDPMLSEFESALAAEIQRVTKEQEAEKKRIAAIRAARHANDASGQRAADERNARSYVGGESIRSGGWARRRRSNQPYTEIGNVNEPVPVRTPKAVEPRREIGSYSASGQADDEILTQEDVRRLAREQERAKAAAARAERVKAARAAQAEAERQAAIAREKEEAEARLKAEAEKAEREAEEARQREEAERIAREIAEREERNRIEREEEAKRELAEKAAARELLDDDEYYDDDDDGPSRGKTVVTVSVIMVLLLFGVGAAMTYFWSNLSVNRPGGNADNTAQVGAATVSTAEEAAQDAKNNEASMTPEESRFLEESRAAAAAFAEEQKAALARAAELEQEERNAMLAEAGMVGLPDISTRDLSEYLTEMPAEGASICTTKSVLYSYDQMVKDLYFLTVRYGDYISMGVIGNTMDQRAIYQAVIGNANASKHIVIYYGLNATDCIDTVLAMNQLEVYCKARKNGTAYKSHSIDSIFEDVCIHVIPMANPDGIAASQYGIDALRTEEARASVQAAYDADVAAGRTSEPIENYLKTYTANAAGVDLSCNFDIGWEEYVSGPETPSASGYKGTAPFSEVETQAIANLVDSVSTAAVIGYGTAGNVIECGFEYDGPAEQGVSNVTDIGEDSLADALTAKTGYEKSDMPKFDESNVGGAAQYFLHEKQIPAVVVRTGSGEPPLDETQMSSIWSANSEVLQMIGNLYTNGL